MIIILIAFVVGALLLLVFLSINASIVAVVKGKRPPVNYNGPINHIGAEVINNSIQRKYGGKSLELNNKQSKPKQKRIIQNRNFN